MNITPSQRTGKFTISGLTDTELMEIANAFPSYHDLVAKIKQSLYDSTDSDEIMDEYGLTVEEYWKNAGLIH